MFVIVTFVIVTFVILLRRPLCRTRRAGLRRRCRQCAGYGSNFSNFIIGGSRTGSHPSTTASSDAWSRNLLQSPPFVAANFLLIGSRGRGNRSVSYGRVVVCMVVRSDSLRTLYPMFQAMASLYVRYDLVVDANVNKSLNQFTCSSEVAECL